MVKFLRQFIRNVVAPIYVFIMEKFLGWKTAGNVFPTERKFIMLAEPHTSNIDMAIVWYWGAKIRRQIHFVIKKEVADWFLIGRILPAMGAIFIDRNAPLSAMKAILRASREHDDFILLVAPSGTRGYSEGWKPGFYFLAEKTKMPLMPAGPDFKNKLAVVSQPIYPSGDIAADIELMRPFYEGLTGRHPEWFSPVRLVPDEEQATTIV